MASPGYRRCPQDTAYPQDTDSVLRIPRYPQDTAGVLRYNYRHDAAVSSGYRVPRMPSVSQDANSRFQMYPSTTLKASAHHPGRSQKSTQQHAIFFTLLSSTYHFTLGTHCEGQRPPPGQTCAP